MSTADDLVALARMLLRGRGASTCLDLCGLAVSHSGGIDDSEWLDPIAARYC
jgi:hypothetical protein